MTTTSPAREPLFPVFLKLKGRRVLLVGAGQVGAEKLRHLLDAGAVVSVVAPHVSEPLAAVLSGVRQIAAVTVLRRRFVPADLDDVWLVVAAGPPEVNRAVAAAAETRRVFVNAVDDVQNASVYLGGVVRRGGVTLAVSTDGEAPALAGLLREALELVLPDDLDRWMDCAREARRRWLAAKIPMAGRRPMLLDALVRLYKRPAPRARNRGPVPGAIAGGTARHRGPVPRAITGGTGPVAETER
jgi:uroporphyrin-III C-methyltransferase/precorrin-2 dehydrogenase/sirohydrochlorin ferrochelatase